MNVLRSASRRPLLRALLLLALAVRAFMPGGVMASAADGSITLQLCTASGIESVSLPGAPAPADRHIDGACLGALADGNPLAPPAVVLSSAASEAVALLDRAAPSRVVPAVQRSQAPRGPPAPERPR